MVCLFVSCLVGLLCSGVPVFPDLNNYFGQHHIIITNRKDGEKVASCKKLDFSFKKSSCFPVNQRKPWALRGTSQSAFSTVKSATGKSDSWKVTSPSLLHKPKKKIIQPRCIVMEKHATLTFSNFSAYSVWLEVKHERISKPLIHAGGGVALGCWSPLSLVCKPAGLENWSTPPLWGDFKLNK